MNILTSLLQYNSIQRKVVIEILKEVNDVLQWTNIQPTLSTTPSSTPALNATTTPISLFILQGRDNFQPAANNALYTSPAFFQTILYHPKPNSRRPWQCRLLQIYNDMLDDLFHKQQLPFVVIAEDDILVVADHIELLYHQIQAVIAKAPPFFSFFTSGHPHQKHQRASYRHGTPFFYMRSSFYQQLQSVCFQTCVAPIDICMSENFLLGQSTLDYAYHTPSNRFIPKELQDRHRRILFWRDETYHLVSGERANDLNDP